MVELPIKVSKELEDYITKNKISGKQADSLREKVKHRYENSMYDAEEPIGVVTAQSLSEPTTQMTMRTYHFAGTAGIQVTLGLPRLLELFDARKEPKTPTMTVYLDKNHQTEEKAKKVAERIKEVKLKDIIVSDVVNLTDLEIKCKLDPKKMKDYEIDDKAIKSKIKLRNVEIEVEKNELKAIYKKPDIRDIFKVKQKLFDTFITGIKGVSQTVINKERDEWIINTLGSDLKKAFKIEGVDPTRTISNNIFEIYKVLGAEAARASIIEQSMYTIEEQGLGVNIRYVMLLSDLMTLGGDIQAIGRYGIAGQKVSVLARASFEETRKHLTRSAVRGEKDVLSGIAENVMVNQLIPIGTGTFKLYGKLPGAKDDSKK